MDSKRPQTPGLGLAIPRSQYRQGRIAGVQFAGGCHVAAEHFDQRL